jgi:hypothetical protein
VFTCCQILFASVCVVLCLCTLLIYLCAGSPIPCFAPSSSRGRALPADLASSVSEAPEADQNQDGDDAEESEEDTSSSTSPPPVHSEDTGIDKKRK